MARSSTNKRTDQKLRKICQANGLKAANQRIEILKTVSAAKDHPSVDLIHRQAKSRTPGISFDTVYRTLNSLEEHKLISRVHHLDDKTRYDPNTSEHHHSSAHPAKRLLILSGQTLLRLNFPKPFFSLDE